MKKRGMKKSVIVILVFLLIVSTAIPVFAATATVNVKFIVKNQKGPYSGVNIQFGKNTKTTGINGAVKFKLKDIPVTTMVMAHLDDPNIPAGHHTDVNLALGAHEDVKVNSTGPAQANLSIMFTEHTDTIVIEYFVDQNYNYGYSNATFTHKIFNAPSNSTTKTGSNPAPANPQPQTAEPDPDMPPEEHFEEMPPEEHFEEMPPEEHFEEMPREEHFEEMPREEFFEEMPPEDEYYGEPMIFATLPGYVWALIAMGSLLLITVIILIVSLSRRKRS